MKKQIIIMLLTLLFTASYANDRFHVEKRIDQKKLEIKEKGNRPIVGLLKKEKIVRGTITIKEGSSISLFGKTIKISKVKYSKKRNGEVWEAIVNNEDSSFFIATKYKGITSIDIRYSIGVFQVKSIDENTYKTRWINEKYFKTLGDDAHKQDIKDSDKQGSKNQCAGSTTENIIDIAVYYTPETKQKVGGLQQIEAEAYHAVSLSNLIFSNSQVDAELNLVLVKELDLDESLPTINELLSSANDVNTQYTHPQIATDKDQYNFDVGIVLISEAKINNAGNMNAGRAWRRYGGIYALPNQDSRYNNYGSVGLVSIDESTSNFTFMHELGHIFGIAHDCGASSSSPLYNYSHGYCSNNQETIMGRTYCGVPRIASWSNGVTPTGSGGLSPDSNPTLCHANAVLSLNNFANRIANYECENETLSDVIIKDTWTDDGTTPTNGASVPGTNTYNNAPYVLYDSVDVWVRNQDDGLIEEHRHEDPEYGQDNYVYIKLRNGNAPITGNVELYVANANTNFTWGTNGGADFSLIGTQNITVGQNSHAVAKIPWTNVPDPSILGSHYCFYIRWNSQSDPMQQVEGIHVWENVAYNNNIAWKNLNIIDMKSMPVSGSSFSDIEKYHGKIHFYLREGKNSIKFTSSDIKGEKLNFFRENNIVVKFDKETAQLIDSDVKGIKKISDNTFLIKDINSVISFKSSKKDIKGHMNVLLQKESHETKKVKYVVKVEHFEDDNFSGGYAFQVQ